MGKGGRGEGVVGFVASACFDGEVADSRLDVCGSGAVCVCVCVYVCMCVCVCVCVCTAFSLAVSTANLR